MNKYIRKIIYSTWKKRDLFQISLNVSSKENNFKAFSSFLSFIDLGLGTKLIQPMTYKGLDLKYLHWCINNKTYYCYKK